MLLAMAGCQPTTPSPAPVHTGGGAVVPLPTDHAPSAEEAVADDPSAARLQDILGAMLGYYVAHRNRLPDTLADIKPYADVGTTLNFTSPYSGQPYVYSPAGLLGGDKKLIVWDPVPNKQGMRWCIIIPHMDPTKPIQTEVVPIPEATFEAFVPPFQ